MARSAVLAGRTLADLSRSLFSLAIMVGLGLLVGFRFHSDAGSILAGLALVIVFGYCFSWMYATIGLATKDPETAQVAGILPFFVLVFASIAIVPVATMPSWLQGFATNQPLSVTVSAVRALLRADRRTTRSGSHSPGRPGSSSCSSCSPCACTATSQPERRRGSQDTAHPAGPTPARRSLLVGHDV